MNGARQSGTHDAHGMARRGRTVPEGHATRNRDNGAFIGYQGVTYTCNASGGCRIEGRTVTRGTIRATGGGGSNQAPDLVDESPSVSDARPAAGASFTLSVTVRNRGDAQSNATTLRYYRSSNETISTSDEEVGTDAMGGLRLEPAFAHDARLKLPQEPGLYRLEGLDAEGRRLFSFSFTPDAVAHGGGSFLFAIPFEPAWTEDLDRITLTGPEGSTTLDRETGGRAALIIDRASGLVRTIARDWSVGGAALPAAMAADAQVQVIRGLPRR